MKKWLHSFVLLCSLVGPTTTYGASHAVQGTCKGLMTCIATLTLWLGRSQTFSDPSVKTLGGLEDDVGWDAVTTVDGGYLIGGESQSYGLGAHSKGVIVQYDSLGHEAWYIAFGGDRSESVKAVDTIDAHTYVMTGYTTSYGGLGKDIFVGVYERLSARWLLAQVIGDGDGEGGTAVAARGDGYYVAGGSVWQGDHLDIALVQFFPNHTVAWNKTFGTSGDDSLHALAWTSRGCVGVGTTTSEDTGKKNILVFERDSEGEEIWSKTVGSAGHEEGYDVEISVTGDILVIGYTDGVGAGREDVLWVRFSSTGILLDAQSVGLSGSDLGYAIAMDTYGNAWVTGYTDSDGFGQKDMLLFSMRNETLEQAFTIGSTSHEMGLGIVFGEGSVFATGYTLGHGAGGKDILAVRFPTNSTLPCYTTITPQVSDVTDILSCHNVSLNSTAWPLPVRTVTWQMYGLIFAENVMCLATEAPTSAPTEEVTSTIKVIATVPTQNVEVGDVFWFQVVPDNLFQTTPEQAFTVQALPVGSHGWPSFLYFNTSTNILAGDSEGSPAGSYGIALVGTTTDGASASLVFAFNLRDKEDFAAESGPNALDYLNVIGPFIGPALGACFLAICTALFCKKHRESQQEQTKLLRETHDRVYSSDNNAVALVTHNNHNSVVELEDNPYSG